MICPSLEWLILSTIHASGGGFTASCRACDQNHAFGEISCGHYFFRDMENIRIRKVESYHTDLHTAAREPL